LTLPRRGLDWKDSFSYGKFGNWGALERIDDVSSPKYDVLVFLGGAVGCDWPECVIPPAPSAPSR
jgi:hypothetical protein